MAEKFEDTFGEELETTTEGEEQKTFTREEVEDLLQDSEAGEPEGEEMFNCIQVELEAYDSKEFNKGIKEASYLAGAFTALKNVGMKSDDIVAIYIQRIVLEGSIKIAQQNTKASIEIAQAHETDERKNTL